MVLPPIRDLFEIYSDIKHMIISYLRSQDTSILFDNIDASLSCSKSIKIIQRKNARGFGSGNIQALFTALELEQARHSNL